MTTRPNKIRFHRHPGRPEDPDLPLHPFLEMDNKGDIHLYLHEGQWQVMKSTATDLLVTAGTQSGKTILGPWWLYREMDRLSTPQGDNDYLAVTASYPLFKQKFLPALINTFCTLTGRGRYHPSARVIELSDPEGTFWATGIDDPMYARIILASASAGVRSEDAGVRQLESATVKAVLADEIGLSDFTLTAWEALDRRRHLHHARLLGMTTLYNFGWLRTKLYIPWTQGRPGLEFIRFDSTTNPAFPKDQFEKARATLPAWKFDMMYRGIFSRPAGQIFESFDEAYHVIPAFPVPREWPVVIGIDPGAGVNTALVWLATDPNTHITYIYGEDLWGGKTTAEMAEYVKLRRGMHKSVRVTGGAASEKQFRLDWGREGVAVSAPTVTEVEAGLDRIIALFKTGRIQIMDSCPKTIAQIIEYARVLDASGEPTEKIQNKEQYHFIDGLRYAAQLLRRPDSWTPLVASEGIIKIPMPGIPAGLDRPPPRKARNRHPGRPVKQHRIPSI